MAVDGPRDTKRRRRLIKALASGMNNTEAAKCAKYSRQHVQILIKDPRFAGELAKAKAKVAKKAAKEARQPNAAGVVPASDATGSPPPETPGGGAGDAEPLTMLEVMRSIARDPLAQPSARVGAACAVLKHEAAESFRAASVPAPTPRADPKPVIDLAAARAAISLEG